MEATAGLDAAAAEAKGVEPNRSRLELDDDVEAAVEADVEAGAFGRLDGRGGGARLGRSEVADDGACVCSGAVTGAVTGAVVGGAAAVSVAEAAEAVKGSSSKRRFSRPTTGS